MESISSSLPKRQREEEDEEVFKRQKSYKDIITLLEEEEDDPNEDLSSLISTLQEEISSSSSTSSPSQHGLGPVHDPANSGPYEIDQENPSVGSGSGEDETENVMRHLLEASDDELGLPNTTTTTNSFSSDSFDEVVDGQFDGGDFFYPVVGGEGLWEFEDREAANYYSLLQSTEIFM
ncbi:hypothetical protein SOVF_093890 [Spinacia oleracea]|uniref:Uncharacterized protein n=1 Tax=Spinacia oleracea TaxID=3562 RepID=A0A9R0JFF2_SPIOL|nr:uncharacterized protein LOC110805755 [Spinacia oleracea]KNA15915.1 hypothetical protein SOVF_093890 [Spinacia oleracea]